MTRNNARNADGTFGRGSVAAGREGSRMARAKEMGLNTETEPYHGTDADFTQFDLRKGGTATGASPGRQGVWLAQDPDLAATFVAGKTNPSTYPLMVRRGRSGKIELDGQEMNHEISATLDLIREQGYNSVLPKNYTARSDTSQNIVVIFDPSDRRG